MGQEKTVRFRYNSESSRIFTKSRELRSQMKIYSVLAARHISNIRTEKSWKKQNGELYCAYSKQKVHRAIKSDKRDFKERSIHQG